MLANPLKFIDDLKNKGVGYGWNVRLPAAPGKLLNRRFLTRDHGSHEEALRAALAYRDEMCKSLPFPLHARVSQYLDGTHKAIQACRATGKLKVRAQWVEFDPVLGADRTRNLYRIVPKPEDYEAVYAEVEAPVPAALIGAVARWHGRDTGTPIPAELNDVVARCKDLFPGFEGGSLDALQATLIAALDELAGRRRRASLALSNWPR